jgi:type IV pilus assembly protein PilQ
VVIANDNFARDLGVRFGASGSTGALGRNELLVGGAQANDGVGLGPYGFFDTGPFGRNGQGERFNSTLTAGAGAPNLWVNLPVQDPAGAIDFLLGKVGSHLITLELSAMQREGRGEIISSPRVVTADQTSAIIEVGQDIPVVTPATEESPATVRYEPATLKLNVTPHITPDDRVIMALEVNKDEADFTFTVNGNPLRNRRAVSTSVLVDNGETIVLGGVFEGQKSFNVDKVPWLGDLPVLGRLFKTTSRQHSNQELLIFVTPKILDAELEIR